MTPNTGPFDMGVVADGVSALFDKIGPGILFTHSQGGGPGGEGMAGTQNWRPMQKARLQEPGFSCSGGLGRNRTADTRIFNPLLYRLSYRAKEAKL